MKNILTPTSTSDAATKGYVDSTKTDLEKEIGKAANNPLFGATKLVTLTDGNAVDISFASNRIYQILVYVNATISSTEYGRRLNFFSDNDETGQINLFDFPISSVSYKNILIYNSGKLYDNTIYFPTYANTFSFINVSTTKKIQAKFTIVSGQVDVYYKYYE